MKVNKEEKNLIFKELKKNQGITLIALVVTIIVLLLLAGVSIAMLTGEGGILQNAREANNKTGRANAIEMAQLDVLEKQSNNEGKITEGDFKEILDKYFTYELEGKDLPENLSDLILTTLDKKYNDIKASEIYNGKFSASTPETPKTIDEIEQAKTLVDKNTYVISDDKVKVTIPAGFTILENSPKNAKEGIIITDSVEGNGNEFVWIPVNSDLTVNETGKVMARATSRNRYK